jgi:S-adenosylmethionine-diacylgycerolhomoserine-N-methlytransferase
VTAAHAALLDRVYRRQRHIYDLSRRFFLFGRDRLIASLQPPPGGHVLEIGCGTARNLISVARRYPGTACYGVDLSRQMLATARQSVALAGLAGRIHLGEGDAADFDAARLFGRARFDRIFFSYSLSMMPPWPRALDHAAALLADGGRLHVVDFGQQEGLPRWFRSALFGWLAHFHVAPRAELEKALAEVAGRRGAQVAFTPLYRGYAWAGEIGTARGATRAGVTTPPAA